MCQVAFEVLRHRVGKTCLDREIGDDNKSPRLAVMRGGCVRCSGENILNSGIRHRVRFEAADRASSPQEVVQVSCGGQSELV